MVTQYLGKNPLDMSSSKFLKIDTTKHKQNINAVFSINYILTTSEFFSLLAPCLNHIAGYNLCTGKSSQVQLIYKQMLTSVLRSFLTYTFSYSTAMQHGYLRSRSQIKHAISLHNKHIRDSEKL